MRCLRYLTGDRFCENTALASYRRSLEPLQSFTRSPAQGKKGLQRALCPLVSIDRLVLNAPGMAVHILNELGDNTDGMQPARSQYEDI
jgi:hypothetical protein